MTSLLLCFRRQGQKRGDSSDGDVERGTCPTGRALARRVTDQHITSRRVGKERRIEYYFIKKKNDFQQKNYTDL